MTLTIREALIHEWSAIADLSIAAYQDYAQAMAPEHWETMKRNLSNVAAIQGQLIVAEQEGTLVGSVVYCPPGTSDSRLFSPEWASVRMLAVSPQGRGQGVGRRLSQACIERAKQDGAAVIALHTSELMAIAQRLYEQLGFQRESELPRSLGLRYWRYVLKLED